MEVAPLPWWLIDDDIPEYRPTDTNKTEPPRVAPETKKPKIGVRSSVPRPKGM